MQMYMTRPRPDVDPERRYCIKEVCDLLNICRDTVRKYTDLEIIVCIRITSREIYYLGSEILVLHDALTKKRKEKP